MTILVGGVAGQDGGDVENDAGLFVCEGVLGGRLVREGIKPVLC